MPKGYLIYKGILLPKEEVITKIIETPKYIPYMNKCSIYDAEFNCVFDDIKYFEYVVDDKTYVIFEEAVDKDVSNCYFLKINTYKTYTNTYIFYKDNKVDLSKYKTSAMELLKTGDILEIELLDEESTLYKTRDNSIKFIRCANGQTIGEAKSQIFTAELFVEEIRKKLDIDDTDISVIKLSNYAKKGSNIIDGTEDYHEVVMLNNGELYSYFDIEEFERSKK